MEKIGWDRLGDGAWRGHGGRKDSYVCCKMLRLCCTAAWTHLCVPQIRHIISYLDIQRFAKVWVQLRVTTSHLSCHKVCIHWYRPTTKIMKNCLLCTRIHLFKQTKQFNMWATRTRLRIDSLNSDFIQLRCCERVRQSGDCFKLHHKLIWVAGEAWYALCVNKRQHCVSFCRRRPWRSTVCVSLRWWWKRSALNQRGWRHRELRCSQLFRGRRESDYVSVFWIINADATRSHSAGSRRHGVWLEADCRTCIIQDARHSIAIYKLPQHYPDI